MDKFYVKPKNNLVTGNISSSRNSTIPCRTSSQIFQTTSSGKRLGVGNICSKIRHKIEDNLTPKISGKLYKAGKHSKSLTALSSIGASVGKYTLSNQNSAETETTSTEGRKFKRKCNVSDSNSSSEFSNRGQSPYAECYNTLKDTLYFSKSSLHSYADSDEDEAKLSLNMANTSLEDEIFQELEKVAHVENKLSSVLETFDKIIFDYNEPPFKTTSMSTSTTNNNCNQMKTDTDDTRNASDLEANENEGIALKLESNIRLNSLKSEQTDCPPQLQCSTNECKKLKKSSSTLSLTRRKCYQSLDSPCLKEMQHAFAQHEKSKSVWELSNATKIPILKAIPLKTRSKSFSYNNSENDSVNLKLLKPSNSIILGQVETVPSLSPRNKDQKSRDDLSKQNKLVALGSSPNTGNATKSQSQRTSYRSVKPLPLSSSNLTSTTYTSLSAPRRSQTGDELLDKCLEKGQQILRKVESLKPHRTQTNSCSRKAVTRTKSTSSHKVSKDNLTAKRKQWLRKLNYANEEKITSPPLESCKIIPPVLGETSDKHAELLVQVTKATQLSIKKQQTISEKSQPAISFSRTSANDLVMKDRGSDSDDSGHISNENIETCINNCSNSSSATSSCEHLSQSPYSPNNGVVTKSLKMSEVLKKFESKTWNRPQLKSAKNFRIEAGSNKTEISTISSSQQSHVDCNSKKSVDSRICTTCRVAEVESVSVIRTHVEIYPNYTKEVTIRLH